MPTARRFTGQIEDAALGLYYYNARYYDPALGRFIQADTVVPGAGNPQALNRYAYTLGNPVRYTDPSGHWWEDPKTRALLPGYSRKSLPDSWKAGKRTYRDAPPPTPTFERLPLLPTNGSGSQWFGATKWAYKSTVERGDDLNYGGYCQGFHCGLDLGMDISEYGTAVRAGLYGTVESLGPTYGAGPYAVNIRVGSYVVIFGHMDGNYQVGVGDVVDPDTTLGGVGNMAGLKGTGGVHMHLEVRQIHNGVRIYNPLLFMEPAHYAALQTVMNVNDFHYTDRWANPLDQPVIIRGGPSLWY